MKTKQYTLLTVILIVVISSTVSMVLTHRFLGNIKDAAAQNDSYRSQLVAVPGLIGTERPVLHTFISRASWSGTVEGTSSVTLPALCDGRIASIDATDQSPVRKGTPIFHIGGPRVDEMRTRLSGEVTTLEHRLTLSKDIVKRAEQNLKDHLSTKDQESESLDSFMRLEAQLREAQLNLKSFNKRAMIIAPVDGIFTNRTVNIGQEVNTGQALGDIVDPSHIRIVASVFCPNGVFLQGRNVMLRTDGSNNLQCIISKVLPFADNNGASQIWIEGPDINRTLRPGQTVSGTVDVSVGTPVLSVPESSVVYDSNEQPFIFVTAGGNYEARKVRLGGTGDGRVEIYGLKADDEVVVKGAYELFYRQFSTQFKVED
jgi:RND family efflux transporter MFP subunit